MSTHTLMPSQIDVWYMTTDFSQSIKNLSYFFNLLSPEEKDKSNNFAINEYKNQYIYTRSMVRIILSHYTSLMTTDIIYKYNENGKPELKNNTITPIYFNITHSKGLIACAVSKIQYFGLDSENVDTKISFLEVAKRYFSNDEYNAILQLTTSLQKIRFFELWTLKESYLKALGSGLGNNLKEISFKLDTENNIHAEFIKKNERERWEFQLHVLIEQYQIALAVLLPKKAETTINFKQFQYSS